MAPNATRDIGRLRYFEDLILLALISLRPCRCEFRPIKHSIAAGVKLGKTLLMLLGHFVLLKNAIAVGVEAYPLSIAACRTPATIRQFTCIKDAIAVGVEFACAFLDSLGQLIDGNISFTIGQSIAAVSVSTASTTSISKRCVAFIPVNGAVTIGVETAKPLLELFWNVADLHQTISVCVESSKAASSTSAGLACHRLALSHQAATIAHEASVDVLRRTGHAASVNGADVVRLRIDIAVPGPGEVHAAGAAVHTTTGHTLACCSSHTRSTSKASRHSLRAVALGHATAHGHSTSASAHTAGSVSALKAASHSSLAGALHHASTTPAATASAHTRRTTTSALGVSIRPCCQ